MDNNTISGSIDGDNNDNITSRSNNNNNDTRSSGSGDNNTSRSNRNTTRKSNSKPGKGYIKAEHIRGILEIDKDTYKKYLVIFLLFIKNFFF